MKIEKASKTGFCSGVKRAVDLVVKAAAERRGIVTLGPVVHNPQVLQRLAGLGISIVKNSDEIPGNTVVIGSHGTTPQQEAEIRSRHIDIINTTCPIVHRAQLIARRLSRAGFFVVIYGEADHPEVKGILGWAQGNGIATMDEKAVARRKPLPRRLGLISQTTQMPASFTEFAKKIIDVAFRQHAELYVIDTICHDIRERQAEAIKLSGKADLLLVVGGRHSANTNHLAQSCSRITETHLIETAAEIQPSWLAGKNHIGVVSGTSTDEQTVDEVIARLEAMTEAS